MRLIWIGAMLMASLVYGQGPSPYEGGLFTDYELMETDDREDILIFSLYDASNFNLQDLAQTLEAEGFSITLHKAEMSADSLAYMLLSHDQLWLVSDYEAHLDSGHLNVISDFLAEGNSLYILADNEPYDADADFVSKALVGAEFQGNYMADMTGEAAWGADASLSADVGPLYEGFTVSSIQMTEAVKPEFVGSDGQVVIASFNNSTYRILLDGGFTRMYTKWNDHSAQYFVNAATWLKK